MRSRFLAELQEPPKPPRRRILTPIHEKWRAVVKRPQRSSG